jgi:GNAT superfamily N-acetyltransferase
VPVDLAVAPFPFCAPDKIINTFSAMQKFSHEKVDICVRRMRPATPDDQLFLRKLFASTRADELALLGGDESQKEAFISMQFNAQSRQYAMNYPQANHSIILSDETPIGRMLTAGREDAILLLDIALLPEYRNAGIGTRLIQDLLNEAAAAGKAVQLHVFASNPAKHLYERLGFSQVGLDAAYLEMMWVPPGSS